MYLVHGHDFVVVRWASRLLGASYPGAVGIGVIDGNGTLKGALLLEMWNRYTAEFSVCAEDGALTHGVAKQFFRHVFVERRIARLQVHTERTNRTIKKAAPKFGFIWDGSSKDFYGPGCHALRFYMTPQSCRWIKHHGIEAESASAA